MKRADVVEGALVAVSPSPNAVVYTVAKVMNFNVVLHYKDSTGRVCTAGIVDTSLLRKPTKPQLFKYNSPQGSPSDKT